MKTLKLPDEACTWLREIAAAQQEAIVEAPQLFGREFSPAMLARGWDTGFFNLTAEAARVLRRTIADGKLILSYN